MKRQKYHKLSVNKSSPSPTKPYDFNHTTCNGILPHCDIMSDKIQHGLQAWKEHSTMVNGVNRSAHHHSHITMNQDNILCTFQAKEQERTQLVIVTSQQQPPYHIQAIQSGTEKGKLILFSNMCTHTDNVMVYTGTLKSNDVLTRYRCHQCEYIRSTLYAGKFVSVKRKAASHILHKMNAIKQFGDGYTNILPKQSLDYITHTPIPKFIDESSQWDHYYRLIKAGVARIDQAKSNNIVNTVQNHPELNEIIMAL